MCSRYKQAFVWWALPGGYFGVGWIRDLWRIPEYVRDANDDPGFVRQLKDRMRMYERPAFSVSPGGWQPSSSSPSYIIYTMIYCTILGGRGGVKVK